VPKHKGLTYFLMDMEQDEVEVRPLRQITGEAEFNELFISNAYVPDENVVGGVGDGWMVAITTLMNERAGLGATAALGLRRTLDELIELARERGLADDPVVRDRLARLRIGIEALRLGAMRALTATMKIGMPGPEGSISKLQWADINQAMTEFALEVGGSEALKSDSLWAYRFLRSRANSIEGGTSDVLKNIVAERVLGLPKLR
jgi:alkylation response protein AidB-like acyl-CoA dehydrogenase